MERKLLYIFLGIILISTLTVTACGRDETTTAPMTTSEPATTATTEPTPETALTSTPALPEDTLEAGDTETPVTDTTPSVLPVSELPFAFSINSFEIQITSVSLGASMFAPVGMAEDEIVLDVKIKVLTGDPEIVYQAEGEFDVWTSDDTGRSNSVRSGSATGTLNGEIMNIKYINWLFGVAQSAKSLYLHFPGRVTLDLSSLLL